MSDEKLYRHEILFYGITISAAFIVRVIFPFEIKDGPFLILGLLFYWITLTGIVQFGCFIGYFYLAGIFSKGPSNVAKERYLSPRHFSAATSSIVTAFAVERIYHAIGNPVVALILIFPIFLGSYELAC
jgi:hypothetical protein